MVKLRSRPFFLLVLLLATSCGEKKRSVDFGTTTVTQLKQELGGPLKEEAIPVSEGKILHYENDQKFQLKGEIVTAGFRTPVGDEKKVLYWRHRFRDCAFSEKKVSPQEIELSCPSRGESVIYPEGAVFISRIIEYEKK